MTVRLTDIDIPKETASTKRSSSATSISLLGWSSDLLHWLSSSITIYAFLLFILLNIMVLLVYQPFYRTRLSPKTSNYLYLSKLRKVVFDSSYEANQSGPWPWWIARAYLNNSTDNFSAPDIAIMGDSQANAAIIQTDAVNMHKSMDCAVSRDCPTLKNILVSNLNLEQNNFRIVNLSVGGAMPSDYFLMSKTLFTKEQHPKLVIITLSPRSFLDATLPSASSTEIFQFFSPFVDLGNLADHAFNNPIQKYFWQAQKKFALIACRQEIELFMHDFAENSLSKLYPAKFNNLLDQSNISKQQAAVQSIYSSNGLISAGSNMVAPVPLTTFMDNKKEYSRRFSQMKPATLTAQSAFLLATLSYFKSLGIQTIVINMPMLQPVKSLLPAVFWEKYRLGLANNCQTNNALWLDLDATNEFPQSEFLDYVHLNAAGGQHFINKLANYIQAYNNLRSCL